MKELNVLKITVQTLLILILCGETVFSQSENFYLDSFAQCKDRYYDRATKKMIFFSVALKPTFPGGPSEYLRWLNKEFRYPKVEDLNTAQTKSMADFIVDSDGRILQPKIVGKFPGDTLNAFEKEFLRVIKRMPNWEPGRCFNKKVAVIVRLPIMVELQEEYE